MTLHAHKNLHTYAMAYIHKKIFFNFSIFFFWMFFKCIFMSSLHVDSLWCFLCNICPHVHPTYIHKCMYTLMLLYRCALSLFTLPTLGCCTTLQAHLVMCPSRLDASILTSRVSVAPVYKEKSAHVSHLFPCDSLITKPSQTPPPPQCLRNNP